MTILTNLELLGYLPVILILRSEDKIASKFIDTFLSPIIFATYLSDVGSSEHFENDSTICGFKSESVNVRITTVKVPNGCEASTDACKSLIVTLYAVFAFSPSSIDSILNKLYSELPNG